MFLFLNFASNIFCIMKLSNHRTAPLILQCQQKNLSKSVFPKKTLAFRQSTSPLSRSHSLGQHSHVGIGHFRCCAAASGNGDSDSDVIQYLAASELVSYGDGGSGGGGGHEGGGDGSSGGGDGNRRWVPLAFFAVGAAVAAAALINAQPKEEKIPTENMPVSIVIPALNEAATIAEAVQHMMASLDPAPCEIIVVDGGSTDGTARLAKKAGAKVVRSGKGRGRQMNAGAKVAKGGILMFVHADSRPAPDSIARAREALANPGTVLGGFFVSIEHPPGNVLRFPTFHNNVSSFYAPAVFAPLSALRGLKCLFGDQSIFCRAADFWRVGGYDDSLPLMEDADLCVRMHHGGLASGKPGREVQLLAYNTTSGRRIAALGNSRSTYIQFRISLAWWLGMRSEQLCNLCEELYSDSYR